MCVSNRDVYRCARNSDWGDQLRSIIQSEVDTNEVDTNEDVDRLANGSVNTIHTE